MIYQLTYTSKALGTISDKDIQDILYNSKVNNDTLKISGCLLFYNHKFYQILEGDEADVLHLFELIKKDERHSEVKIVGTSFTKKRLYKEWGMLYQPINRSFVTEQEIEQFKQNLLLLENFTETSTEAEIWFWREIKKGLLLKEVNSKEKAINR
ncbi:BLUF domain-containing protein [Tenacibaculum tangerinum]|uniref:BLUF domain-containing protein n=1 Tax=Tenacibaculum tangerinum TaxID=3038772 RepID=A0ABY8L5G1_9FLAO|nr:BLUF domain-containing protein [Tenacibaculum tangerinum]WGH75375.1 BLUF domain-containing protein [Tenacibaculum tangerinum]